MKHFLSPSFRKQRGVTMIELIIGLVIIGIITAVVMDKVNRGEAAKDATVMVEEISQIVGAAKAFRGRNPNYTGVSMTALTGAELLTASWGTGAGVNAVGGNYTVAPSGVNMLITATGMTDGVCISVSRKLQGAVVSATCASGTLTVTAR